MNLTIVLRTCLDTGVINMKRICDVDRITLVSKCIKSLVKAINNSTCNDITFYVLDDHSSEQNIKILKDILKLCKIKYEFINLPEKPSLFKYKYNFSAYEQFRYGKDFSDGLVYFVEDDYFHAEDAIDAMLLTYFEFRKNTDLNEIAIYPYDSTHNYYENLPTRLIHFANRLWRTTNRSANTLFIHSNEVRKYWFLFDQLATHYNDGKTKEDNTINRLWNNTITHGGPISLFSPIPSVAIHLSVHDPITINTEMFNWKQKFDATLL